MSEIFATAWKEGVRTLRCGFFEATGLVNCPFHKVRLQMGMTIVGPIYLYAAKQIKKKYPSKRRKKRGK